MDAWLLTTLLFGSLLLCLILGMPIVFSFGGLSILFMLWQWGPQALYIVATTLFSTWTDYILITVPLFVLMGAFLERSGMADDLYEAMYKWMGPIRGGLAMGTVAICAVFGAMSGISAIGTLTMGLVALPSMLRRKYDKIIAIGCISAGGTLAIVIPPSVPMIIYASLTGESVGLLFMGGLIPGILLACLFMVYIGVRCYLNPELGPAVPQEERMFTWEQRAASLRPVILAGALITAVLVLMYMGVTTASEAAGVGAFGALLLLFAYRRFNKKTLNSSLVVTLRLTGMVMWILLGAKCFSHVYTALGAAEFVREAIAGLGLNRWIIMVGMQLVLLFLGCFMDPAGIMTICVPVFVPIIKDLGFNSIWFGVLFTINMEMGYITPPFGFNLFYMRSLVPKGITMDDIYRSIIPYVILEAIGLTICMIFPQLVLWLPNKMMSPTG